MTHMMYITLYNIINIYKNNNKNFNNINKFTIDSEDEYY